MTVWTVVDLQYPGRLPAVDVVHKPNSRLPAIHPSLSAKPAFTFPALERHRP